MARPLRARIGRARRHEEARRRALARGDTVSLPCRLRRTSARGWGPWTDAVLVLGPLPDGGARWRADDPVAVGLPVTRGHVDLAFSEVEQVALRGVRFQTEAFYGRDGEIVVVTEERATIEVALPQDQAGAVAERLDELLLGGAGHVGR